MTTRGSGGPSMSPLNLHERSGGGGGGEGAGGEERWRHLDNSVNAVSFGFVATAILISMFLVMAIFERFLRPRSSFFSPTTTTTTTATTTTPNADPRPRRLRSSSASAPSAQDLEAQRRNFSRKLDYPSPKMSIYAKGVSVLMPGNNIPTFIAHPAPPPVPCPPERILWPPHLSS